MVLINSFPDDDDQDDDEDDSSDGDEAKKDNVPDVQNRIFLNNFIAKSGGGEKVEKEKNVVSESSDSDPEEGIKKNPMFPLLY